MLHARGYEYPAQAIAVFPFASGLAAALPAPAGLVESKWPPVQVDYLDVYLQQIGCATVVSEAHYIDRDFVDDFALFYARNLRPYPNYCQRLHFFTEAFDAAAWQAMMLAARDGDMAGVTARLQASYLGFSVIRPLPGSPIGRTVLPTLGRLTPENKEREFPVVRPYHVHLAGFALVVNGLAFQQQDQGVSACATTALWVALQRVAHDEHTHVPTPAEITESASRYLLADGRSLPSDGLRVEQICEATRASGLAPVVVKAVGPAEDRAQLISYVRSGFPTVLAMHTGGLGHAICCVGVKLGATQPQTDTKLNFRDGASRLEGIYVHDDRLGPYASVQLQNRTVSVRLPDGTVETKSRTGLLIRWPDGTEETDGLLHSLIVPLPVKIRLSVTRLRALGFAVAEFIAKEFPRTDRAVTLDTRYELGTSYRQRSYGFGLSDAGLIGLASEITLSRYVGLIEIVAPDGPLLDVVLDATESGANPCVLACVRRNGLPPGADNAVRALAKSLGAASIV